MDACIRSRAKTSYHSKRNQAYETTYKREFSSKKPVVIVEGAPPEQRFLVGCPFNLADPVGETIYTMDFSRTNPVPKQQPYFQSTSTIERPDSKQLPCCPRRYETLNDPLEDEIKQALRNQLDSTYQVDYTGSCQGFQLPLAYNRPRAFWRNQVPHTFNSEYRNHFQNHSKTAMHFGGRFKFTSRVPADAIVPQTLPTWKKKPLHSIYSYEISQKTPSERYMRDFVDSFGDSMK
ncbi:unnamed protein product [Adineta steineri]|uniref:Uncharacterized protein n=1 Tax=Adineta steineri TaxID=433720 RepID=A0A815MS38_9BILA|nr:unnamed protein product [Adineta steineri]